MPEEQRRIGFVALLFVSVGGILGSGWLFGPLYAAQLAGPAALIAWVIGGFAIMVIALNFAELGAMLPFKRRALHVTPFSRHGRTVRICSLPFPVGSRLRSSSQPRCKPSYNTFRSTCLGLLQKYPA